MSLAIEIKSNLVQDVTGVSRAGKPFHLRKQVGWASTYDQQGDLNPYPERIDITLNDEQDPFPVGHYKLSPKCLYVGDFNCLAVGRLILDPVRVSVQRAA